RGGRPGRGRGWPRTRGGWRQGGRLAGAWAWVPERWTDPSCRGEGLVAGGVGCRRLSPVATVMVRWRGRFGAAIRLFRPWRRCQSPATDDLARRVADAAIGRPR